MNSSGEWLKRAGVFIVFGQRRTGRTTFVKNQINGDKVYVLKPLREWPFAEVADFNKILARNEHATLVIDELSSEQVPDAENFVYNARSLKLRVFFIQGGRRRTCDNGVHLVGVENADYLIDMNRSEVWDLTKAVYRKEDIPVFPLALVSKL